MQKNGSLERANYDINRSGSQDTSDYQKVDPKTGGHWWDPIWFPAGICNYKQYSYFASVAEETFSKKRGMGNFSL